MACNLSIQSESESESESESDLLLLSEILPGVDTSCHHNHNYDHEKRKPFSMDEIKQALCQYSISIDQEYYAYFNTLASFPNNFFHQVLSDEIKEKILWLPRPKTTQNFSFGISVRNRYVKNFKNRFPSECVNLKRYTKYIEMELLALAAAINLEERYFQSGKIAQVIKHFHDYKNQGDPAGNPEGYYNSLIQPNQDLDDARLPSDDERDNKDESPYGANASDIQSNQASTKHNDDNKLSLSNILFSVLTELIKKKQDLSEGDSEEDKSISGTPTLSPSPVGSVSINNESCLEFKSSNESLSQYGKLSNSIDNTKGIHQALNEKHEPKHALYPSANTEWGFSWRKFLDAVLCFFLINFVYREVTGKLIISHYSHYSFNKNNTELEKQKNSSFSFGIS